MGLVQPASAVLYDYYNPGETSGTLGRWGLGAVRVARESCGSMGLGRQGEANTLTNTPLCFSPEHKCSVFYGAPRKSKFLSTLCSADVCQCAEGETLGRGSGVGRRRGWGLHSLTWAPDFREVPSTAPGPGAWAAGHGGLPDEICLLLSPSGLRSVFPPGPWP